MSASGVSIPRTRPESSPRWRRAVLAVLIPASLAMGAMAGRLTAPDGRTVDQPASSCSPEDSSTFIFRGGDAK